MDDADRVCLPRGKRSHGLLSSFESTANDGGGGGGDNDDGDGGKGNCQIMIL